MSDREFNLFKEQLHKYNSIFGHYFMPDREVLVDDAKRENFIELAEKSCKEKHDYVAEYYNIDVEHMKKQYDVIYD